MQNYDKLSNKKIHHVFNIDGFCNWLVHKLESELYLKSSFFISDEFK